MEVFSVLKKDIYLITNSNRNDDIAFRFLHFKLGDMVKFMKQRNPNCDYNVSMSNNSLPGDEVFMEIVQMGQGNVLKMIEFIVYQKKRYENDTNINGDEEVKEITYEKILGDIDELMKQF